MNAPVTIAENLCEVVSNEPINAEYRLLLVKAPQIAMTARAGQFFHLKCPQSGSDRPFLRRPMSVYRIDREHAQLGFLYKVTGVGTRALAALRSGEILDAMGPLGVGFRIPQGTRHVLIVARGVGLATMAPMAGEALAAGARVTAFLSARRADLLMSREELEAAGATVEEVTDADGSSAPASLRTRIEEVHAGLPFDLAATCGSNRLYRLVRDLCTKWEIAGQIALEARMGCGLGMCLACVVTVRGADGTEGYKRVCRDGPVFDIREATGW